MEVMLHCVDYRSREVVLTEQRWRDLVIVQHPELEGFESTVELALTTPAFVNHDATHPNRESHYCHSPLPASYAGVYIKVVVEYVGSGAYSGYDGEVVTANAVDRPKPRERRKWTR
ncbi:MAG: hypothetical protein H0W06_08795 [Chloroflexia bacterium]|nr:hypothetical protein [Chloroflexia bacterium]